MRLNKNSVKIQLELYHSWYVDQRRRREKEGVRVSREASLVSLEHRRLCQLRITAGPNLLHPPDPVPVELYTIF